MVMIQASLREVAEERCCAGHLAAVGRQEAHVLPAIAPPQGPAAPAGGWDTGAAQLFPGSASLIVLRGLGQVSGEDPGRPSVSCPVVTMSVSPARTRVCPVSLYPGDLGVSQACHSTSVQWLPAGDFSEMKLGFFMPPFPTFPFMAA